MGRTSATSVRATASDPTRVAKAGDVMTGTLVVPAVTQIGASTSATTNYTTVTGDGGARYAVFADGKTVWGAGAGTLDTNLYRSAADTLKTDDTFSAAALAVSGVSTFSGAVQVVRPAASTAYAAQRSTGDTQYRFVQNIDGLMSWGDGTNPQDTNLYRGAPDVLKTDDVMNAAGFQVSGVGLGTWVAYTATLSGTGWALGDSTLDCSYMRIGKTVWFSIAVAWGATATFGAASTPRFTLPSAAATAAGLAVVGSGKATGFDIGTNKYEWHLNFVNATTVAPVLVGANGDGLAGPTATTPFTWAAGDGLLLTGHYREA